MKKLSLLFLAVAALTAVQCINAEEDKQGSQPRQGDLVTIVAALEQPILTKTSLTSERKVLWNTGDQIKVYNSSNSNGVVYTLSGGAGTSRAEFSGAALSGSGPYYAVYPASAAGKLNGDAVSVTLPTHQAYASGSFGSGAALSMAKGSAIASLVFKNVLGGISFSVSGSKSISQVRLQTKGGEALSGSGTVTMSGDNPSLSMNAVSSDDNSFLFLDGPGSTSGSFSIMLPPGAFSNGFLVEFLDSEGNVMFRSAKAGVNQVVRSKILDMPESAYSPQYNGAFFTSDSFGMFDNIGAGEQMQAYSYNEIITQYAYKTTSSERMVRVTSLPQGFSAELTTPKTMTLGYTYEVSVNFLEGSTENSFTDNFVVLQKTADRVWLVNDDRKVGIIQKLED